MFVYYDTDIQTAVRNKCSHVMEGVYEKQKKKREKAEFSFFDRIIIALSYLLHGITFEQFEGISGVLVIGISISLTMGAIFIPMVYLAGEDKTIVFLIISLICALGIATMLFNIPLFGPFILIGCSILLFIVSFPLTVGIFKKKHPLRNGDIDL